MIFPRSISALAEKNDALLQRLNFDPAQDDPFELDTAEVYRESGLFAEDAVTAIFNGADVVPEPPSKGGIFPEYIGMVLVRPDMYHVRNRIERFVSDRFRLVESQTVEVSPKMYWEMYQDAILDRELPQGRLSRAAVYIGSPCQLLFFAGESQSEHDRVPVADYVYANLKGEKGIPQPGTLRGEVVYESALELGLHHLRESTVALAVDPFGAYRRVVAQKTGRHELLHHPLLFFTGVGVHVPNHAELQKDAVVMTRMTEDAIYE